MALGELHKFLEFGSAVAAFSVQNVGAVVGLRSYAEIREGAVSACLRICE